MAAPLPGKIHLRQALHIVGATIASMSVAGGDFVGGQHVSGALTVRLLGSPRLAWLDYLVVLKRSGMLLQQRLLSQQVTTVGVLCLLQWIIKAGGRLLEEQAYSAPFQAGGHSWCFAPHISLAVYTIVG